MHGLNTNVRCAQTQVCALHFAEVRAAVVALLTTVLGCTQACEAWIMLSCAMRQKVELKTTAMFQCSSCRIMLFASCMSSDMGLASVDKS